MNTYDAASSLRRLMAILDAGVTPGDAASGRRRLTALLTAHGTSGIPEGAWPLLHNIWGEEAKARLVWRAAGLPRVTNAGRWTDAVSLWRGDITSLQAGAIVNAANAGLTGCYIPFHACVDNAIHTAAGPWLRQACENIMAERRRPQPVATATVTEGFYLPARYVIHTVGPIVRERAPSSADRDALAGCYRTCLAVAVEQSIESVAFCAISTGVFGYPKAAAAHVALAAIRDFLAGLDCPPHVILVAYTEDDEAAYRNALDEAPE